MLRTKLETAVMNCREEQIDGYRLHQNELTVAIDERESLFGTVFRVVFGLTFMFPLILFAGAVVLKDGLLGMKWDSNASHYPIGAWLIVLPFICVPFVFAFIGISTVFARSRIEAASDSILIGSKWFGVWPKLKAKPISEIRAIKIDWQRRGVFASRWVCVVSILLTETGKSVALFSCSEKEAALKLAKAVSEITKLPLQEVPRL